MRKLAALLASTALIATLGACSNDGQEAAQICVDPTTNMRIDDSMCRSASPFIWWYITPGYTIPAYGWPVAYGYAYPPRGYHTSPAPSSGGVIPRTSRFDKRTSRQRVQTVQPTSAATQAPPPKKPSVWNRSKPAAQPQARTQPQQSRPQSKPQWQTYKAPPASRPAPPRPPTYSKYR